MAQQRVWIGPFGPFIYDDESEAEGLERKGARFEGGLLLRFDQNFENADRIWFYGEIDGVDQLFGSIRGSVDTNNDLNSIVIGDTPAATENLHIIHLTPTFKIQFNRPVRLDHHTPTTRDELSGPESGWVIYNELDDRIEFYNGTEWRYLNSTAV